MHLAFLYGLRKLMIEREVSWANASNHFCPIEDQI